MDFEQYKHHGTDVWVRKDLKGKHRDYCLCYQCKKLYIEDRERNCPISNQIFGLCVREDLVLPVWECRKFEPI